jgi:hypothetical protein
LFPYRFNIAPAGNQLSVALRASFHVASPVVDIPRLILNATIMTPFIHIEIGSVSFKPLRSDPDHVHVAGFG